MIVEAAVVANNLQFSIQKALVQSLFLGLNKFVENVEIMDYGTICSAEHLVLLDFSVTVIISLQTVLF